MACLICVGALAAFGLLTVFWCLFGWFLPKTGGWLVCPEGADVQALVRRFLWLRGLGALDCSLLVLDQGLTEPEKRWLESRGIELCGRQEFLHRLGIGENESNGTGTSDPAGRHQRGGVPEL